MATQTQIRTGTVHHIVLTVSDVERSRDFYRDVLGFEVAGGLPPRVLLTNGSLALAVGPAPERPAPGDRFDENRIGLDHLSFNAGSRADLEHARQTLAARGIPYGEIKDLPPLGISVLAFRDPDNIQLELTAPMD